ncbi:amino acid adenylation domain-containing protein, partial [Salmonella enterica subsp. enterica serovar Java]|nr:amino acid adenylation domain-containing protein [Salmonella enterica subsp. enterica serovar Java]
QTDGEPAQSDALLHQLFHRQARRQPQAPAVFAERRTLTYGELQRRVIALGDLLRNNGVRPGDVVAVLGEKGWPAVVAVLGVLEAGAAYLPLAADLPPLRLRQLLDDSGARLVLTTAESAHRTEPDGRSWMATAEVEPAPQGADPRETQTDVQAMAYLIYTSGSTGAPKGVMVSHAAAVNTLLDLNRRFAIGADDRVLALSALNFDLSVYDIFGTLAAGGGIVMPDTGRERDAEHWLARMIRDGVTVWNSVPALLQMLLSVGGDALAQAAPRLVWLSGDWIPPHVPTQVRSCWPASHLVSMGGATEAAIWSIGWEVPETGVPAGWSSVPYGTALGNQQVWVLDDHLEPCPEWVSGEIYLGGRGLAQGYWRDEERSTRHFITHPRSGERLYRTGDRGRWRPEGWIEFQGRDDGQVKIRGHRIELGE